MHRAIAYRLRLPATVVAILLLLAVPHARTKAWSLDDLVAAEIDSSAGGQDTAAGCTGWTCSGGGSGDGADDYDVVFASPGSLGLRLAKDLEVLEVDPAGVAAGRGIRKGDRIVAVNGAALGALAFNTAVDALKAASVPRTLRLRPPYKPGGGDGAGAAGADGAATNEPERTVVLSNSRPHGLQLSRDLVVSGFVTVLPHRLPDAAAYARASAGGARRPSAREPVLGAAALAGDDGVRIGDRVLAVNGPSKWERAAEHFHGLELRPAQTLSSLGLSALESVQVSAPLWLRVRHRVRLTPAECSLAIVRQAGACTRRTRPARPPRARCSTRRSIRRTWSSAAAACTAARSGPRRAPTTRCGTPRR